MSGPMCESGWDFFQLRRRTNECVYENYSITKDKISKQMHS